MPKRNFNKVVFFRTPFLENTSGRLPLLIADVCSHLIFPYLSLSPGENRPLTSPQTQDVKDVQHIF